MVLLEVKLKDNKNFKGLNITTNMGNNKLVRLPPLFRDYILAMYTSLAGIKRNRKKKGENN